jgi:hypothetical protein
MRRIAALLVLLGIVLAAGISAWAEEVSLEAAGPIGAGYVGIFYGLVDPAEGSWYVGSDFGGGASRTWMAVVDTGSSACILGTTTQLAYEVWDGVGLPLQPYPDVKFTDVGFGGSQDFAVTEPLQLMMADFKTAYSAYEEGLPEDLGLYTGYGPIGGAEPPTVKMAAALEPIGGGLFGIDFDIIGMSVLEGRLLHVDPHYLGTLRIVLGMAGSLERPPPWPTDPRAMYVPATMHGFFEGPQTVEVGDHVMVPIYVRKEASDPFAVRTALFDTGSPVNFVSESFALEAGIDLGSTPDLSIAVGGVGPGQSDRPGWYVDALALDLGRGREGDQLVISNTAVIVIPDAEMPGGLEAILGNAPFSLAVDLSGLMYYETPVVEWYVDTRDPEDAYIIVVLPATPGDANFDGLVDGGDYTIWADNYLKEGSWGEADFNADGLVEGGDYTSWADNYTGHGGQSVPGPGTVFLLILAAPILLRPRR